VTAAAWRWLVAGFCASLAFLHSAPTHAQELTLYSIGDPTGDEQYYLELINRARSDPHGEGEHQAATTDPDVLGAINYFGVNLAMMRSEFDAISATPPLSMNAKLLAAARGHSNWMFQNAVQSHYEGAVDPGARITSAGYTWGTHGENIFAYSESVYHGQAGFEIDWGFGTGGMQGPPRGHRNNIHSSAFREVGIGVTAGSNTAGGNSVGPQLVTQDFATASGSTPFVTGVVYYDVNGNGFYDSGEGVGGVAVNVSGATYYALTANSGGYSVPVPNTNTTRSVSFSGLGMSYSANATISNLANVKQDYVPTYFAPAAMGPSVVYTGSAGNDFTFNSVGGATQYGWRYSLKTPAPVEGCDSLTNVTTATTSGYNVVDTSVKDSAPAAFHLAHPNASAQIVKLNADYYPATGASMQFRSRLGWATASQIAKVHVSTDGGNSWSELYTQAGSGASGESSFNTRTVSLAAYAGSVIKLRFAYLYSGSGSYYDQTTSGVGWYVDSITFTNTSQLGGTTAVEPIASTGFTFSPPSTGTYLLSVRPYISGRYWNYGPVKEVTAQSPQSYSSWIANQYPQVTSGPSADYDKDGLTNGIEFAFGLNPTVANVLSAVPPPVHNPNSITASCTQPAGIAGVTYGAQYSTNLFNWTDIADSGSGAMHTFTVGTVNQPRMFVRWKITITP
jgi:hypothetical protein